MGNGHRSTNQPVALALNNRTIRWAELESRKNYWLDSAQCCNDDHLIAAYHPDAVEFLAILLALWQSGKVAVVPGNTLPVTLDAVGRCTAQALGEIAISRGAPRVPIVGAEQPGVALVMFTSGSTGVPTPVVKTFAQLDAELAIVESEWGRIESDAAVFGTVSHHHMYGLIFRLLWPWVTGRVFCSQQLVYFEQLSTTSIDRLVVVTSPAHLDHLPQSFDWTLLADRTALLLSAGAPLSAESSRAARRRFGVDVTEIYGTTETGAVASRQQLHGPEWLALTGVDIGVQQQRLVLESATAENGRYWSQDIVELCGTRQFRLLGRADRIVKVGGKRVSLEAVSAGLISHDWVAEVKILVMPKRRERLGAAVILTAAGRQALVDQGKLALSRALTAALDGIVEAVARPRYWRFVTEFPVDSQGKTTAALLGDLFAVKEYLTEPQLLASDTKANSAQIELMVPSNLLYLQGHFPGTPILPGVVQVQWAQALAQQIFGELGSFLRLEKLKFQQVIFPQHKVGLTLVWNAEDRRLDFSYSSDGCIHSSGRIVFSGGD